MAQPTPGRYTVVYEGDPSGIRVLSGEPAPGRATAVMAGDSVGDLIDAQAEVRRLTRERDRAMEHANEADARVVAIATEKCDLLKALRQLNAFAKKAATLDYNEDITVMGIAHYTATVDALIAKATTPEPSPTSERR